MAKGGERAFMRLQEEIIKESDDQSIFSWSATPIKLLTGFLAPRPSFFRGCKDIAPPKSWRKSEPYSITNCDLRITGIIGPSFGFKNPELPSSLSVADHILLLKCCKTSTPEKPIGLLLKEIVPGGDQFARVCGPLVAFEGSDDFAAANRFSSRTIYVRKQIKIPTIHESKEIGKMSFLSYISRRDSQVLLQLKRSTQHRS
jgi:hypothetical protein